MAPGGNLKTSRNGSEEDKDPFGGGNPLDITVLINTLRVIRERWVWGLTVGLIVAFTFGYFSLRAVPRYETSAVLMIESRAERVLDVQQVVDTSIAGRGEAELDIHLRQMNSRTFRVSVAETFDPSEQRLIQDPYRPDNPDQQPPTLMRILESSVSISRSGQIFNISARHRSPEAAQLIANRIAAQYINNILTRSGIGNESAIVFLEQQTEELRNRITATERRLNDYRRKFNLVSLEESLSTIGQRLSSLSSQLTSVRIEQLSLESALSQVEDAQANNADLTEIPVIASFGAIPQILANKKTVESLQAELSLRYLERHPRMIEVDQRLAQVDGQLERETGRAIRDLQNRLERVNREYLSLAQELQRAEQDSLNLDQNAIEYNVLRRQLESDRQTFDSLIDRLNETNLAARLNTTNLRILDEATLPGRPVEPNPSRIISISILLLGICLFGIPLLLELLDHRLKSGYDVEEFIGKPLLGDIPQLKDVSSRQVSPNIVANDSDPIALESIRTLYSSLQMATKVSFPKTVLVTSTHPGEGKSFISTNMASMMARHDLRVLIMDCDFRRPILHRINEMRNDHGTLAWFEAVQSGKTSVSDLDPATDKFLDICRLSDGVDLLRSGGSSKRGTELIDSEAFERLLSKLRDCYDVVIIDTAPVSIFTETLFLSESVDEILYVVRFNRISRQKVSHFIKRLDGESSKVAGVVINGRTSSHGMRYGYDYNYSYYSSEYKYYKAYDNDEVEKPVSRGSRMKQKSAETRQ